VQLMEAIERNWNAGPDVLHAAILAAIGWQPIETAPKDGTIVDLWGPKFNRDGIWNGECRYASCRWSNGWQNAYWCPLDKKSQPTHWMPLPAAPQRAGLACSGDGV
jgi:hypothetical protein